jgi:O-antigen/teichoic acid export membrane protein
MRLRGGLLGVGVLALAVLLGALPLDWLTRAYRLEASAAPVVALALAGIWLTAEAQSLQQVRERFRAYALWPLVADLCLAIVILVLMAQGALHEPTFVRLDILAVLAATTAFVWLLALVQGAVGAFGVGDSSQAIPVASGRLWPCARFSLPLLPAALIGYASEWLDYFLIGRTLDAQAVGLYHPACQYLLLLVGLPTAVAVVILPRVVGESVRDGGVAIRRLVTRTAPQALVLWAIPALLASAVLPGLFSLLLGDRFVSSVPILQILLVAVPGAIVQHVHGVACFAQGRLGMSTVGFFGLKCLVDLTVSLSLLPAFGLTGAAAGMAFSYLVLQWLFVIDQWRCLRLAPAAADVLLVLVHAFAVVLALVDGLPLRVCVALLAGLVLVQVTRRSGFFAPHDFSRSGNRLLDLVLPLLGRVFGPGRGINARQP